MSNEIKPVELCIEADEVVKRYPITEALEIVRCRTSIYFHSTGFFVVSKPTLANNLKGGALFETLQWYCDYMDSREEYSEEDREKYDTFAAMVVNVLTLPLDVFTDIDFMLNVSEYILKRRNEYYERLNAVAAEPRQETLEDALENAAFEGEVLAQEQLVKELNEMGKKDGTDSIAS
ncbi:MAG: hypothetical protein IKH15_07715 [Bacteroidales bacterium]|nr:hypothetical protein [Bacteroidales bacterium]